MSYLSIDTLQKVLSEKVFLHTKDSKKAAGRALGTIVEIISYYLLKEWGLNDSISIERRLAEYGNSSISHNVEFTMHPLLNTEEFSLDMSSSATSHKINQSLNLHNKSYIIKSNTLLNKQKCLLGVLQERKEKQCFH